jgi:hypothetical protein
MKRFLFSISKDNQKNKQRNNLFFVGYQFFKLKIANQKEEF